MNHYLKDLSPGNLDDPHYARYFFGCCSLLAYRKPLASEEFYKKAGFTQINLVSIDGAQAYVLSNESMIVVAFRGTEVQETNDIWADLQMWKAKRQKGIGLVHTGFKEELDKVWSSINDFVSRSPEKTLYLTGHSLGGAMATLAGSRLEVNQLKEVYTYGAPRVGNSRFNRSLRFIHHRIQNNNDVVCKVPQLIFGYRHQCKSVYINHYGNIRKSSSFQRFKDQLRGRWRALKKWQLFDGVYDHSIDKYCRKLHNQWKKENDRGS